MFEYVVPLWKMALAAGGVAIGTWLLTGQVLRYVRAKDMLDHPNARSAHTVPTPRGGGLAIVLTAICATVVGTFWGWVSTSLCLALCVGGGLVAWIGWRDDKHHIAPHWRVLVHGGAAVFAVYVLGGLPVLRLGSSVVHLGLLGFVVGALGVVWAINFYNFMDGIDGIASIEGALVGICAVVVLGTSRSPGLIFPSLIIAATCVGFLPWNWSPSKMFMGDVGSGFLGYWFAVLAIASENTTRLPALAWVLLLGVFVFDATATLVVRLYRGEQVYEAHQFHAYQRTVKMGLSHRQVSLCVGTITTSLGALVWWATSRRHSLLGVAVCATIAMTIVYVLLLRRSPSREIADRP